MPRKQDSKSLIDKPVKNSTNIVLESVAEHNKETKSIPGYKHLRGDKRLYIEKGFTGFNGVDNTSCVDIPPIHSQTIQHSPYHLVQLLILILQDFFSEGLPKDYYWKWTPDFETTQILFDTVFNKESAAIAKKPIIVVSHGDLTNQRTVIGNTHSGSFNLQTGSVETMNLSLGNTILICQVVSSLHSESSLIATLLFNYFIALQSILPPLLGIHQVHNVNMSTTSPIRESETMYVTTVSMPVSIQLAWLQSIQPTAELLHAIGLKIQNFDAQVEQHVLKELNLNVVDPIKVR